MTMLNRLGLALFLVLAAHRLPAAELPAAPPALRELLAQELALRELSGLDAGKIDIAPAGDGESYQARVGTYLFFLSPDGSFILPNNVFDYAQDLDDAQRSKLREETLRGLREERVVVFAPPPERPVAYTITVFTDASCPFCAKFHHQVEILNQEGVKVRYLAFPREGLRGEDGQDTPSYQKTVAVWCNPDPHQALADAMAGKQVAAATCANPVEAFYWLGESFGVAGTPTIVFDNGDMWVGYYSAIDILEYLGNHYFPPRCQNIPPQPQDAP